jgi:hypothetical protein
MKNLHSAIPAQWVALASMVVVALVAVAVVFAVRSNVSAQPVNTDWPSLTMTYEIAGQSVLVGSEEQSGTEVRRMEYTSKDNWTETIIEAPNIDTTVGTFNAARSYRTLNNGVITEYDAITDSTTTTTAIEGSSHVAGPAFVRYSINALKEEGFEFSRVSSDAKVCFQSSCEDNVSGVRMTHGGQEYIFVDDVRGIPLKFGSSGFRVREVLIDDERQAVVLSP